MYDKLNESKLKDILNVKEIVEMKQSEKEIHTGYQQANARPLMGGIDRGRTKNWA